MITTYLLTSFVDKLINMFAVYQKKIEYFLLAGQCIVYSSSCEYPPYCDLEEVNLYG